jgi:hypothetical protein
MNNITDTLWKGYDWLVFGTRKDRYDEFLDSVEMPGYVITKSRSNCVTRGEGIKFAITSDKYGEVGHIIGEFNKNGDQFYIREIRSKTEKANVSAAYLGKLYNHIEQKLKDMDITYITTSVLRDKENLEAVVENLGFQRLYKADNFVVKGYYKRL